MAATYHRTTTVPLYHQTVPPHRTRVRSHRNTALHTGIISPSAHQPAQQTRGPLRWCTHTVTHNFFHAQHCHRHCSLTLLRLECGTDPSIPDLSLQAASGVPKLLQLVQTYPDRSANPSESHGASDAQICGKLGISVGYRTLGRLPW